MGTKKFSSYITENGKSFMYFKGINKDNKPIYIAIPISTEITLEQAQAIIELDHRGYLDERYYRENKDVLFDLLMQNAEDESYVEDLYFIDTISPEAQLFGEEEVENPLCAIVRRVVEEECTEAQQELFYKVYGMGITLEEIRQEELRKGTSVSKQAMTNRLNKILDKVAMALGVTRINRR